MVISRTWPDNGSTWHAKNVGIGDTLYYFSKIIPAFSNRVVVIRSNNSSAITDLFYTDNYAQNWSTSNIATNKNLYDVISFGKNLNCAVLLYSTEIVAHYKNGHAILKSKNMENYI